MKRIAIVGAGISGLTCAWYLQKFRPDATIDLIEASDRIGGVIQTVQQSPYLAELAADNVATFLPEVVEFIRELGIESEFTPPNQDHRFAQVVRQGKLHPIPNGFSLMQPTQLWEVFRSPVLSLQGKLRVLAEYFVRPSTAATDESVESFAVRRLGRECFDRLVEPIIGGIFTARAETLSMDATMRQFRQMEKEYGGLIRAAISKRKSQSQKDAAARKANGARYDQFLGPKHGMSWWMDTIHSQLKSKAQLQSPVSSISRSETGKWLIEKSLPTSSFNESTATIKPVPTTGSSTEGSQEYDAVCLALPSWKSADLLQSLTPSVAGLLDRIPYASSAIAVLAVPKEEIRKSAMCFGVVVPKIESRDCLAISLTSEKYSGRCPRDTVIVRVFMGGMIRPELLDLDDERLLQIARQEIKALLGVTSLPRWQKLVRWNQAMPQYLIGHTEKVQSIRAEISKHPGLYLIGNAYEGVGVPQCIRMAKQTALQISQALNADEVKPAL